MVQRQRAHTALDPRQRAQAVTRVVLAEWRVLPVQQLVSDVKGWRVSAKVVPVMRAAMAAAFIALVMVQAAESLVAATEPERERSMERRKKNILLLPTIPQKLSLALSPHRLLHPFSWQW